MAEKKTNSKAKAVLVKEKKTTNTSVKKTTSKKNNTSISSQKKSPSTKKTSRATIQNKNTEKNSSTKKVPTSKTSKKTTSAKITINTKKAPIKTTLKKNEINNSHEEQKEIKKIVTLKKKANGNENSTKEKKESKNNTNSNQIQNSFLYHIKKTATIFLKQVKGGIVFTTQLGKKMGSKTKIGFKKSIGYIRSWNQKIKEKLFKKNFEKTKQKSKAKILKNTNIITKSKKRKSVLIVLAILCLLTAILLKIPYGITTYKSGASNRVLDIPKLMKLKEECCNYSATFSSPRSIGALRKDVEKIINSYEKLNCDGKNYYYNSKENFTITEYSIERGIILNKVHFVYGVGNSCDIDTKFKKLELLDDNFSLEDAKKDGNYVMEGDKIFNKKAYDDFIKNVSAKIPSTLRIVSATKEGDVLITDIEYLSSGKYIVSFDGTRDRNSKNHKSIVAYKFEHLKVYKNKLYAYNGDKLIIKKAKKYETYYLLTLPVE